MDQNSLNELSLNSSISSNDLNLINKILNTNGKKPKISAKETNDLINKLSSTNTLKDIPQKDFKDMNENEKKIYREELKKKIKNKSNEKKMLRTNILNNKNNYTETLNKLSGLINNLNLDDNTDNTDNTDNYIIDSSNNKIQDDKNELNQLTELNENLDDYVN